MLIALCCVDYEVLHTCEVCRAIRWIPSLARTNFVSANPTRVVGGKVEAVRDAFTDHGREVPESFPERTIGALGVPISPWNRPPRSTDVELLDSHRDAWRIESDFSRYENPCNDLVAWHSPVVNDALLIRPDDQVMLHRGQLEISM